MRKKLLFILLPFSILQSIYSNEPIEKHVIGCLSAGFFSSFFGVLNNLNWCLNNNKTPVVFWDHQSLYYNPAGYNESLNVWEYYFEPVSSLRSDPQDTLYRDYDAPDGFRMIQHQNNPSNIPDHNLRKRIHRELIVPFIKIKKSVQNKVDEFFNQNMKAKNTIGIHLRGTDKSKVIDQVSVIEILNEANKHATPDCQFFVATDENALLESAKSILRADVIYYDVHRATNKDPIHHCNHNPQIRPLLGQEVLIEVLLLAQCNKFIHTTSNVSTAVLLFNPELENIVLSPPPKEPLT